MSVIPENPASETGPDSYKISSAYLLNEKRQMMPGSTQVQMVQGPHDGTGQRLGAHKTRCHMSKGHTDHEILSPGEQSGSGSMQDRE